MIRQAVLRNLVPGKNYAVQVRSKNPVEASVWSNTISFTTAGDNVAPAAPTGVDVIDYGTSFKVSWNEVTLNADDTPISDLKDYEVSVTANSITEKFYTVATTFDFSWQMNVSTFGTAQESVEFSIRARDTSGNLSSPPSTFQHDNTPPANVSGLTLSSSIGTMYASWLANTESDLDYYEVYADTEDFTPDATNLKYQGKGTIASWTFEESSTWYVKMRAVDIYGNAGNFVSAISTPSDIVYTYEVTFTNVRISGEDLDNGQHLLNAGNKFVVAKDMDGDFYVDLAGDMTIGAGGNLTLGGGNLTLTSGDFAMNGGTFTMAGGEMLYDGTDLRITGTTVEISDTEARVRSCGRQTPRPVMLTDSLT
jgi:hypothetical protein